MPELQDLLKNNKEWIKEKLSLDSSYFDKLAKGQSPEFLWLGCSDSRVPANEITGTTAGDMFIHRNIANMALPTDFSFLSVLQYAVEALKVNHIIVCGHYYCGGVSAALANTSLGLIDQWIMNIKNVYATHRNTIDAIDDHNERVNKLVELNVGEQVKNIAKTNIVQKAWKERELTIHPWVFDLASGQIITLNEGINNEDKLENLFKYNI